MLIICWEFPGVSVRMVRRDGSVVSMAVNWAKYWGSWESRFLDIWWKTPRDMKSCLPFMERYMWFSVLKWKIELFGYFSIKFLSFFV